MKGFGKKMRSLVLWVLLLVGFFVFIGKSNSSSDSVFSIHHIMEVINPGGATVAITNRKLKELKERSYDISTITTKKRGLNSINEEDYPRFDPSPSSKATINTGPIEHGTPLNPYIPRPTPRAPAPGPS